MCNDNVRPTKVAPFPGGGGGGGGGGGEGEALAGQFEGLMED